VPRTLGCDHDHVHALGRDDLAEVDVESVGEAERLARTDVRGDLLAINGRLDLIRKRHDQEVAGLGGLGHADRLEMVFDGQLVVRGVGQLGDNDLDA